MKSKILKVISRIDFQQKEGRIIKSDVWKDVYTYDMLRSNYIKKNKSVALSHQIGAEEEILFLIQNGLNETDSVIITEKFISISKSNWFGKNENKRILWSELSEIKLVNHNLIFYIKNGDNLNFDVKDVFTNNLSKEHILVTLLQDILKSLNGKDGVLVATDDFLRIKGIDKKKLYIYGGIILVLLVLGFNSLLSNKTDSKAISDTSHFDDTVKPIIYYDTIYRDTKNEGFKDTMLIEVINVFNEPKTVTLKSSGFFSNGDRVIIPVEMPKNIEYWFYTLNLSNAKIVSGDTSFLVDNVSSEIDREIGENGTITSETQHIESNFAREILNSINKPTKEEAYVNAYFINKENEAYNFQEKIGFSYDINNSLKNTHSCIGLNKYTKGDFVYIGLENEGYKDNIYANIEVVAIRKVKKYYKIQQRL